MPQRFALLPVALSASNAYTLSFIVATYMTLWTPSFGIVTCGKYSACPITCPSTGCVKSFPNCVTFTFSGVKIVSFGFAPNARCRNARS